MKKKYIFFYFFLITICITCFIPELEASEKITIYKLGRRYDSTGGLYYVNKSGTEKEMPLYQFKVENGSDPLCLQSGLDGAEENGTIYYKDEDFDLSKCNKEWSTNCGLASIIAEGNAIGSSYGALEMAIRLYNVYKADPSNNIYGSDGAYDYDTGLTDRENIYLATANAIMDPNIKYDGSDPNVCTGSNGVKKLCTNVLYGIGNSQSDVIEGIKLFKNALQRGTNNTGLYGWVPEIEITNTTRDQNSGKITFTLQTNFNSSTEIEIPEKISGYNASFTKSCSDTSCTIYITIAPPSSKECVSINFNLEFLDSRYSLDLIQKYVAAGGRKQEYLTYLNNPNKSFFPIQYEWCESTDGDCCPDMRIQEDLPLSCDTSSEGTIEDPEMCTILNACDKNKQKSYDFTDEIGMNSNYCKLYCREEIKFTFMDKTDVIAGRQFKYDVNSKLTSTHMLSTVVYATRECAVPDIDYEKWEQDYLAADENVVKAWNELKKWEALYNNIDDYEIITRERRCADTDCCIECEDGTNNCCTKEEQSTVSCFADYDIWYWGISGSGPFPYNKSDINGGNSTDNATHSSGDAVCHDDACDDYCYISISEPTDSVIRSSYRAAVNSYKSALEKREKLLMDIQNCNLLSYNDFTYLPQEYYIAKQEGTYIYSYGESNTAYYKLVNSYTFDTVIDIDYEDAYSPMIEISSDDPVQDNDIKNSWCKDCDYSTYCGSTCTNEISINNSLSTKTDLRRIVCDGYETGANCEIVDTIVPNNDAALIKTSKEQHFWQSAKFYTQLYTGTVSTTTNELGYWIGLDDYIYPISLNKQNGSYGVYVDISNIGAATRPENIKIDDQEFICSFNVINETIMYECDPRTEECYIECDPTSGDNCDNYGDSKIGLGVVVRSVDLTNLFPTNRTKGMNWKNATKLINAIQNLGEGIWTKNPQYVIELTPTNIKNIKEYNNSISEGYMDYSLECDLSKNCISSFLTEMTNKGYASYTDLTGRNLKTDVEHNFYKYGG